MKKFVLIVGFALALSAGTFVVTSAVTGVTPAHAGCGDQNC